MSQRARRNGAVLVAGLMLVLAALACSALDEAGQVQQRFWTPAVVTAAARPSEVAIAAAQTPQAPAQALPAAPAIPLATDVPAAIARPAITPTSAPTAPPTVDPHQVVITESDIADAIAGGAGDDAGAAVENLKVRFTGGKTWITANRVSYSLVSVQNLNIVGRLVAQEGALQLETESVSPQGLVSAVLPGVINQALKQYASRWYVENVQTLEGRIELRIR